MKYKFTDKNNWHYIFELYSEDKFAISITTKSNGVSRLFVRNFVNNKILWEDYDNGFISEESKKYCEKLVKLIYFI